MLSVSLCLFLFCIPALSNRESDCTTGDLRLVGGSHPLEGTVEICINNAWGTICDNEFSSQDAEVICRQIGELPDRKHRFFHDMYLTMHNKMEFHSGTSVLCIGTQSDLPAVL